MTQSFPPIERITLLPREQNHTNGPRCKEHWLASHRRKAKEIQEKNMRSARRSGTPSSMETTSYKLQYSSTPNSNTHTKKNVGTVSPGDSINSMENNDSNTNNMSTMMAEYPIIERQYTKMSTLSTKLAKYTRGSDRRQVLRTLHDSSLYPKLHTLQGYIRH